MQFSKIIDEKFLSTPFLLLEIHKKSQNHTQTFHTFKMGKSKFPRAALPMPCVGAGFYPARRHYLLSVGRGALTPPPITRRAPCQNPCHCEPVLKLAWQSVPPPPHLNFPLSSFLFQRKNREPQKRLPRGLDAIIGRRLPAGLRRRGRRSAPSPSSGGACAAPAGNSATGSVLFRSPPA